MRSEGRLLTQSTRSNELTNVSGQRLKCDTSTHQERASEQSLSSAQLVAQQWREG